MKRSEQDTLGIDLTTPHWSEWYVTRSLLFSPACRREFREDGYGPNLFRCPVALQVVAWALLERSKVPRQLEELMAYKANPLEVSFGDFSLWPLYRSDDLPQTTEWDEVQYQAQYSRFVRLLHAVRGNV